MSDSPASSVPSLRAEDLDHPTLGRVQELLATGDAVGADLVLRRWERTGVTDTPEATMLLVRVAIARGDSFRIAETAAAQLQRTPARPDLRMARARSCYMIGWLDEALETVQSIRAAPTHPLMPQVRWWHARILVRAGRFDEARAVLRSLAAIPGGRPSSESLLGEIEMLEGDLPAARRRLELVLADESSEIRPRRDAAFNLARICDRLDDPDAAFEAAAVGHAMRPSSFDPDAYEREIDDLIDRFDAEWFENAPIGNLATEQAVLIVGLPRSGTSLLEQIIASHPRAGGVGERQDPFLIMQI